jgi:hypothetical protein
MSINQLFDEKFTGYFDYCEGRSEVEMPYPGSKRKISLVKKQKIPAEKILDSTDPVKPFKKRKMNPINKGMAKPSSKKKAKSSNDSILLQDEKCDINHSKILLENKPNFDCCRRNPLEIRINNCAIEHIVVKSNPNNMTLFFFWI